MKLLISFLLFPAFLALVCAGLLGGFFHTCSGGPLASEYSFTGHILKAFLYLAVAIGIPLSVFSAAASSLLCAASFIFKSWTRAVVSGLIAFSAFSLWFYFLNAPFPS